MNKWYYNEGTDNIVICSKIELSRNIKNYPFPNRLTEKQKENIFELISSVLYDENAYTPSKLSLINLNDLTSLQRSALVERKIVPEGFLEKTGNKYLFLSKDESINIRVCDEDHIKLSILTNSLSLEENLNITEQLDSIVCSALPIAFNENFGFLTECPTNLGTGMTVKVLLHLPALEEEGSIGSISESVMHIGLSLKPYDDNHQNCSNLYMLTNHVTLGITEREAVNNLDAIAKQIASREKDTRMRMDRRALEDKVMRSLGVLKSAKRLSKTELDGILSNINLGLFSGIIPDISMSLLTELYLTSGDNMLKLIKNATDNESARSDYIKDRLNF